MTPQQALSTLSHTAALVQAQTAMRQVKAKLAVYQLRPDYRLLDEAMHLADVAIRRLEDLKATDEGSER